LRREQPSHATGALQRYAGSVGIEVLHPWQRPMSVLGLVREIIAFRI